MMTAYLQSMVPVIARPRFVFFHQGRADYWAREWTRNDFLLPEFREQIFPHDHDSSFVQFIGILAALDFCHTDPNTKNGFVGEWNGGRWAESWAIAACMRHALDTGTPFLDAHYLATIEPPDVKRVFGDIPLLEARWKVLREIGLVLREKYDGQFMRLLQESRFCAFSSNTVHGIVPRLTKEFSFFEDAPRWQHNDAVHSRGHQPSVYFRTRAQQFVTTYHARATHSSGALPLICDMHHISPQAEAALPRPLVDLGILQYAPILKEKINGGVTLVSEGREEMEIRAQSVRASEYLRTQINNNRRWCRESAIHHGHLNYFLLSLSLSTKTPAHICETTAY